MDGEMVVGYYKFNVYLHGRVIYTVHPVEETTRMLPLMRGYVLIHMFIHSLWDP
jgi:hypothetical protein